MMRVLVACEFTGTVREAFRALGHDAWSCDIVPTERPGQHIVNDVRNVFDWDWDLMIAHPPCEKLTYAANHCWNAPGRAEERRMAMEFFMQCYNAPIPRICIENPVGIMNTVFRKPDMIIHPYYFGDQQLKRTCLWLKGLPKLWYWKQDDLFGKQTMTAYPEPIYATQRDDGSVKLRHFAEAKHGNRERSRTFPAIAAAFASQWGGLTNAA